MVIYTNAVTMIPPLFVASLAENVAVSSAVRMTPVLLTIALHLFTSSFNRI